MYNFHGSQKIFCILHLLWLLINLSGYIEGTWCAKAIKGGGMWDCVGSHVSVRYNTQHTHTHIEIWYDEICIIHWHDGMMWWCTTNKKTAHTHTHTHPHTHTHTHYTYTYTYTHTYITKQNTYRKYSQSPTCSSGRWMFSATRSNPGWEKQWALTHTHTHAHAHTHTHTHTHARTHVVSYHRM